MSKRINRKPYVACQSGIGAATTTMIAANALPGGAGRLFCLKALVLCNSHATQDTTVTVKHGSTIVLDGLLVKANQPASGVSLGEDGIPGAAQEAWTITTVGAGTLSCTFIGHLEG